MQMMAKGTWIPFLLLAGLGIAVYWNAFNLPFELDDEVLIVDNQIIRDLKFVGDPAAAEELPNAGLFKRRYIAFASLALNYRIHGLDPKGYHVVNIGIHVLNAFLMYLLFKSLLQTPRVKKTGLSRNAGSVAFLAAAIFLVHPVNTEAVNYVVQRGVLMVAFFGGCAIWQYIRCRNAIEDGRIASACISMALVLGATFIAVRTKENAVVIPFVILLVESAFFRGRWKRRVLYVAPVFAILLVVPMVLRDTGLPLETVLWGAKTPIDDPMGRATFDGDYLRPILNRQFYAMTQARVVLTYLRLFMFPVDQNFFYNYPITATAADPAFMASMLGHVGLISFMGWGFRQGRKHNAAWLVPAFGIAWFYVTLAPESSIIPIPMLIAEYRCYLPGMGFLMAVAGCGFIGWEKYATGADANRVMALGGATAAGVLIVALSFGTYKRNNVWARPVSLWLDVVEKATGESMAPGRPERRGEPGHGNANVYLSLGKAYNEEGNTGGAIRAYSAALQLDPNSAKACYGLGNAYRSRIRYEEAKRYYLRGLEAEPDNYRIHGNLALVYSAQGDNGKAIRHLKRADELMPGNPALTANLGTILFRAGQYQEAEAYLESALRLDPGNAGILGKLRVIRQWRELDAAPGESGR